MTSELQSDLVAVADLDSGPADIELTVDELVAFAMRLHRESRWDGAEKCYHSVLEADANNATATHYLGVLMRQRGKKSEGFALIQKSIRLDATVAPWQNNLGNVLLEEGRYEEAAAAYARCTELDPVNIEVLNNLGVLLQKLNRPQEAEASFKQALALNPVYGDAHANLATHYSLIGQMGDAFSHFADALALKPADMNTRRLMVIALGKAGRFDEGRKVCEEWLALEPNDPKAQHFLAVYGGKEAPDRASDQYVIEEFDGFANSFEAKLASLEYKAPQLVGDLVAGLLGEPKKALKILDAGCGTGLCAPFLHPYAKELVGVDLSANMLSRAYDRHQYDELVKSELVRYITGFAGQFDVIVSADTLCYFGKLSGAFTAVKNALCAGGHWVFTVESHETDADFKLQSHGRYSHSRNYVEAELGRAGFKSISLNAVQLRFESGEAVEGWLVSAS
jgi:predicted TPR repeat methyltransferase